MRPLTFLIAGIMLCGPIRGFAQSPACEAEAAGIEEELTRRFCTLIKDDERNAMIRAADERLLILVQENPENAQLCVVYARFSWHFGEQSRTLQAYRRALQLDPENVPAMQGLAECYLRDGRLRDALDILKKAGTVDPANPEIQADIGWIYTTLSNEVSGTSRDSVVATGLRHYKAAVDLQPRDSAYAQGFGEAIYSMQRPDWSLAMAVWQRVRALNPDKDMANYHLVRATLRLGRKDAADHLLEQIPLPRRDQISRYLTSEADQAGTVPASSAGPTVVTNSPEAKSATNTKSP